MYKMNKFPQIPAAAIRETEIPTIMDWFWLIFSNSNQYGLIQVKFAISRSWNLIFYCGTTSPFDTLNGKTRKLGYQYGKKCLSYEGMILSSLSQALSLRFLMSQTYSYVMCSKMLARLYIYISLNLSTISLSIASLIPMANGMIWKLIVKKIWKLLALEDDAISRNVQV